MHQLQAPVGIGYDHTTPKCVYTALIAQKRLSFLVSCQVCKCCHHSQWTNDQHCHNSSQFNKWTGLNFCSFLQPYIWSDTFVFPTHHWLRACKEKFSLVIGQELRVRGNAMRERITEIWCFAILSILFKLCFFIFILHWTILNVCIIKLQHFLLAILWYGGGILQGDDEDGTLISVSRQYILSGKQCEKPCASC